MMTTAKSRFEEWLRKIEAESPGARSARIDKQALMEFMATNPTKKQADEFLRQQIEADQVRRKRRRTRQPPRPAAGKRGTKRSNPPAPLTTT